MAHADGSGFAGDGSARSLLPSYREPPVTEVALALQFSEISPFSTIYGAYHNEVRSVLPLIEEQDPIPPKFETFADLYSPESFSIELVERVPSRRVWFLSPDKHRLVQLQPDRIIQNWRKREGAGVYPRFDAVLGELFESFTCLKRALREQGLQAVQVNQCEVSYFNDIPLFDDESFPQAFQRAFVWPELTRFQPSLDGHTLTPEGSAFNIICRVLDGSGEAKARLYATAQSARVDHVGRVIRLTMVFRGPPPGNDDGQLREFLLLGRETIVRVFTDITSEECHKLWQREA